MQHITDKELNILKYFYKNKTGYVRRIKKSVHISEHTLIKYLRELESKKILASKMQGNLKVFEIDLKNSLVKIFFSYFDILRLWSLEYNRRKILEEFSLKIKDVKVPYFILLFGSTAKEEYTKTSDLDLIIVYDEYDKKIANKLNILARNLLAERNLRINFILMKLREFIKEKDNKENYALQDALQTGYPILGNNLFYEVLF